MSKEYYGRSDFLDQYFAGRQTISVDKLDEMVSGLHRAWPEEAKAERPLTEAIRM